MIVAALEYATQHYQPTNLVIFSDSLSSIEMFDSLNMLDEYWNGPITAFVNIIEQHGIWCRVFHIPGEENDTANALGSINTAFEKWT
jgi:hypothetical protein